MERPGAKYQTTKKDTILHIKRHDLLPLAQIWLTVLHANISPCTHTSDVQEARSIMDGLTIDLGRLISLEIRNCANYAGTTTLTYLSLITHLCSRVGVDVIETPFERLKMPINKAYILKYCFQTPSTEASSSSKAPAVSSSKISNAG
ncbi:hypothetical protein E2542_SST12370 [Spatholobus suberectus]|nr:hypothetical protein E2542_SST12370 [Spatholobus suberectus]